MSAVVTHRKPSGVTAWFIAAGIALAALNLRTAVTSVGTVLDTISAGLGMSGATTGFLTTLPVLSFAAFGAVTPALSRRLGERSLLLAAIALLGVGQAARALVDAAVPFLLASTVALAGGAIGNVVIPALIKRHFPRRGGAMTTVYSTALAVGTMVPAAATVPVQEAAGGNWHVALGVWAALAVVAAIPWLALSRSEPERRDTPAARATPSLLRSRLGWAMAGYFGTQSLIAYVMFGWLPLILRDNGYSAGQAGLVLAVFTGLGIPISIAVPPLATRRRDQRPLVIVFVLLYAAGFAGLLTGHALWPASIAVAVGMGSFPLALSMLALRTRSAATTSALSAFGQSTGYLIAGAGPITFGLLHQVSGGWALPFGLLFAAVAAQALAGWYAGADRTLEDEGRHGERAAEHAGQTGNTDGHTDGHTDTDAGGVPVAGGRGHASRGVRDLVTRRSRTPVVDASREGSGDAHAAARPRTTRRAGRHGSRPRGTAPRN
ncbi:MFS transporter [Microbispora sp. RL4-1S]|uniref:MFS transporter n=1 Tax=Microbispora oryzae TaxID=2806554 RepID=A0A940WTF0_9ACTN|nr:MFS transporter [Microbispora oryzae]MBP2706689.1 MFS transporter [Microbispora oryzae]